VSAVELEQIRIYLYIIGTGFAVVIFYYYIIYLYRNEKKGNRDYEKYGNLALDDELDSQPLEDKTNEKKE